MDKNILEFHYKMYPKMQIKDAVKLIYQNEFGGGHLVKDESASLEFIMDEIAAQSHTKQIEIEREEKKLIEKLGNGVVRINLAALKSCGITPATVNKLFVLSAADLNLKGNIDSFKEKLKSIYDLPFNFDREEVNKYLTKYAEAGYPMVSHSDVYRREYKPAYRVIDEKYVNLLEAFVKIDTVSKKDGKVIIGIDGMCGSGKSTIADILSDVYGCDVIRMDDFFLPPELRTDERLNEIGGNIHYERFKLEVSSKLKSDKPFNYRIFDCSIMNYNGTRKIQSRPQDIIIIEGSYSHHPKNLCPFNIKIFINIPSDTQEQRIRLRDGDIMWDKFQNIWIPMENRYFDEYKIKEKSDIVIEGI